MACDVGQLRAVVEAMEAERREAARTGLRYRGAVLMAVAQNGRALE